MGDNLYEILGVSETASESEIKSAYRTLAKKHHPDKMGDEEIFKKISTAYETLSDKDKRQKYDSSKSNPYNGTPFEDIFSQMFGTQGQNPFRQQRRKMAPDKIIKVQVDPLESFRGSEKIINYMKDNHCDICSGSGGEQQQCKTCGGSGFQVKSFGTGFMVQQIRTACATCAGRGYTLVHKCHSCDGRGVKTATNEVKIKLPIGVDDGQYLKIENSGDFKNGEYGDLVVQIEMVSKDGFEKINNDLIYNLFLNLDEIQQEKFIIPHPDGDLGVLNPKAFDTSKPLRLKGKGYPNGDMYIKLNVRFERTI